MWGFIAINHAGLRVSPGKSGTSAQDWDAAGDWDAAAGWAGETGWDVATGPPAAVGWPSAALALAWEATTDSKWCGAGRRVLRQYRTVDPGQIARFTPAGSRYQLTQPPTDQTELLSRRCRSELNSR